MYSHRNEFPQEFGYFVENDSSKMLSCIRARKTNSPRAFLFLHVLVLCRGWGGILGKLQDKNNVGHIHFMFFVSLKNSLANSK